MTARVVTFVWSEVTPPTEADVLLQIGRQLHDAARARRIVVRLSGRCVSVRRVLGLPSLRGKELRDYFATNVERYLPREPEGYSIAVQQSRATREVNLVAVPNAVADAVLAAAGACRCVVRDLLADLGEGGHQVSVMPVHERSRRRQAAIRALRRTLSQSLYLAGVAGVIDGGVMSHRANEIARQIPSVQEQRESVVRVGALVAQRRGNEAIRRGASSTAETLNALRQVSVSAGDSATLVAVELERGSLEYIKIRTLDPAPWLARQQRRAAGEHLPLRENVTMLPRGSGYWAEVEVRASLPGRPR